MFEKKTYLTANAPDFFLNREIIHGIRIKNRMQNSGRKFSLLFFFYF